VARSTTGSTGHCPHRTSRRLRRLRPLLAGEDEETSKLSREHAVVEPMLGLMLVAGGKYTTTG